MLRKAHETHSDRGECSVRVRDNNIYFYPGMQKSVPFICEMLRIHYFCSIGMKDIIYLESWINYLQN